MDATLQATDTQATDSQETRSARVWSTPAWCRALTVSERHQRLSRNGQDASQAGEAGGEVPRRYTRWREQYPFSRDRYFQWMQEEKGMSQGAFEKALAASEQTLAASPIPPPAWMTDIQQAYANPTSEPFEPPEGNDEIGFLNLIDPMLEQALYRMWRYIERLIETNAAVPFDVETIGDVLLMNLPDLIIQRLGRTLVLELNVLRLQGQLDGEAGRDRFLHFVRKLREPEFVSALCDEYPVLIRQLGITIDQWLGVSLECLGRLCRDWELLKSTFSPGDDPGPLVRLAGGAGDTHRRGRSVMIAEFESGLRIVYKPKSLAIDLHFQELVDWLNEVGCEPPMQNFITLDRIEYGWAEFVRREECNSEEELRRFYQRQGIYLALLHVLASTDFHFENVIASGEHPMLIDLETMLQPVFERYDVTSAESQAMKHMADSVLAIGLLPMRIWSYRDEYQGIDISGLGGASGQLSPDRIPGLADRGTDAMRYIRERVEIEGDANRPMLDGVEASAIDYIDEITTGFELMYRLVLQHRDELLRPGGYIDRFADDSIRVLMRPTRTYFQLLYESFHPDMLRDQADRDLFLDRLWLVVPERNHMKEVIASEQEDLLHGDIPVFTSFPSSLDLYDASDKAIPGVLVKRGIDNVRERILAMSPEDLRRQLWYIRASISSVADAIDDGYHDPKSAKTSEDVDRERLLATVRNAADAICADAFETSDSVSWVGLQSQYERYWSIASLGIDLYAGSPGVALFLAYAGKVLEEPRYTKIARKAYDTIQLQCELAADLWSAIGGYEGWGGVLYVYTQLGALWEDDGILDQAERIANRIWPYIEDDTAYDVVRGSAGAIQALLALHTVRPSETLIRLATMCGEHLLEGAQVQENGVAWTPSRFDFALAGYAHGAAGIATSLLRLYNATGDKRFREIAVQALQYERGLFDRTIGNWPDPRTGASYDRPAPSNPENSTVAWCRGAAGIGISRIEVLRTLDDSALVDELHVAVETTLEHGFGGPHCLCHGDLGNLELLLSVSRHPDWSGAPVSLYGITNQVLDSIERYGLRCGGPAGVFMQGMMVGAAGIGYQLLHIAEPNIVPSILTLAPPPSASA